jgi:hypothetical protein
MTAGTAKAAAARWIADEAAKTPGFAGAFLHGSIVGMADEAPLSPSSDVDVMVVREGPLPAVKPGKFVSSGVMLDVTDISWNELGSAEDVLGQYHFAGSFRYPSVLADPTGRLRPLNLAVARGFARRTWVRRRCADAMSRIERNLVGSATAEAWHDRVTAWLFGTGVMTHVLLVAGLRNPTVRTRYAAVRDLLRRYGRHEVYETLLVLQGSAGLRRDQVERHLAELAGVFDVAAAAIRTPVFFATDISPEARAIAIDGSRELIERGDHREAVFWIVATYARCLSILDRDAAPELHERYGQGFDALLADLGIVGDADLAVRAVEVRAALPWLLGVAEEIIEANPEIVS